MEARRRLSIQRFRESFALNSERNANHLVTCNKMCYVLHMNRESTKSCESCGKVFERRAEHSWAYWGTRKYCSQECRYKECKPPLRGESVTTPCEFCKKMYRLKMANYKKAKKHFCSQKCRTESGGMSYAGEKHWNWKGGVTDENRRLRNTPEYHEWRLAVYKRDHYTCQKCKTKCTSKTIVAHHIKSFMDYPGLRHDVDNGRTLCRSCHKKVHKEIGLKTQFKSQTTAK